MDSKIFTPAMAGRLVKTTKSLPGVTIAFVPNPLPPGWVWPQDLWPLLLDAKCALSSLGGTGKHLPNPEILLQPLQRREAQLSSKLEGTITDPPQQVLFDADPRYPTSAQDPNNALREVFNYRRALRSRLDKTNDLPLSLRRSSSTRTMSMPAPTTWICWPASRGRSTCPMPITSRCSTAPSRSRRIMRTSKS